MTSFRHSGTQWLARHCDRERSESRVTVQMLPASAAGAGLPGAVPPRLLTARLPGPQAASGPGARGGPSVPAASGGRATVTV